MAAQKSPKRAGRPAKAYSQAERLLRLYDKLCRGGEVLPRAESRKQGVDRRTIQRDIRALTNVLPTGAIEQRDPRFGPAAYFMPGARSPLGPTLWQVLAVAVGARMTGFLSGRAFETEVGPVLQRLRSSLPASQRYKVADLESKIHVVGTGQKDYRRQPAKQRKLANMIEGLLGRLPLDVRYHSYRRKEDGRPPVALRIHPLCLTLYNGAAYFVVDVVDCDDAKLRDKRIGLALDRLLSIDKVPAAQSFEDLDDFDPAEFYKDAFGVWTGEERHEVRLLIDKQYAPYVEERFWHVEQDTMRTGTDELLVELRLSNLQEVQDWILTMGEHVEVLGPPELRSAIQQRLQEALSRYQTEG